MKVIVINLVKVMILLVDDRMLYVVNFVIVEISGVKIWNKFLKYYLLFNLFLEWGFLVKMSIIDDWGCVCCECKNIDDVFKVI